MIGTLVSLLLLGCVLANPPRVEVSNIQPGDKVGFSAIYSANARRFGFELVDADGNALYRLAFRHHPDDRDYPCTVQSDWRFVVEEGRRRYFNIVYADLPTFVDGEEFRIDIECNEDSFVTSLNGAVIEGGAGQRDMTVGSLADIASLNLWGGAPYDESGPGMYWKSFTLPVAQHMPDPADEVEDEA